MADLSVVNGRLLMSARLRSGVDPLVAVPLADDSFGEFPLVDKLIDHDPADKPLGERSLARFGLSGAEALPKLAKLPKLPGSKHQPHLIFDTNGPGKPMRVLVIPPHSTATETATDPSSAEAVILLMPLRVEQPDR